MLWQSWGARKVTFEQKPEEEEEPWFSHLLPSRGCRDARCRNRSALAKRHHFSSIHLRETFWSGGERSLTSRAATWWGVRVRARGVRGGEGGGEKGPNSDQGQQQPPFLFSCAPSQECPVQSPQLAELAGHQQPGRWTRRAVPHGLPAEYNSSSWAGQTWARWSRGSLPHT